MSMTREEAIEILENWKICHYTPSREAAEVIISALDPLEIITALRPVSREQVEKVWGGEWIILPNKEIDWDGEWYQCKCSKCGNTIFLDSIKKLPLFCMECYTAMTDEAVELLTKRLEALYDNRT